MLGRLKNNLSTVVIVLIGLVGLGLLLYPTVSDWWNGIHQTRAIAAYDQAVAELDPHEHDELLAAAERYNARLAKTGVQWHMSAEQTKEYEGLLDITGTGVMGYVDIPKVGITLPIYHGTRDAVLQVAIGHLAGTSLPVGGKGTHACISGHRGLPSARLFTDIDLLDKGDLFTITVLDRLLTYEVDQVRTVLPTELDDLAIDPQRDYVTLMTCTPYGVNSHRLLIRGHRVGNVAGSAVVLAEAVRIEPRYVALFLALPLLVALLVWLLVWTRRNGARRRAWRELDEELRERRDRRRR